MPYAGLEDRRACQRKSAAKFNRSVSGRAYNLMRDARYRSKKKGLEFDLTSEWVLERLSRGCCEVTGLSFVLEGNGFNRAWSPTLDRTDNAKGYTRDNVKVVCWMYNAAKGTTSHENVLKMAEALCHTAAKS